MTRLASWAAKQRFRVAIFATIIYCVGSVAAPTVDEPAPSFEIQTLDGRTISLANSSSKVVVLSFWATWCPPCREEMPTLDKFYREHRDEGLEIIGISMDDADNMVQVQDVAKHFHYPIALAPNCKTNGYGRIWVLPLTFVIDRKGILRKSDWTGAEKIDAASLDKVVLPLLKVK